MFKWALIPGLIFGLISAVTSLGCLGCLDCLTCFGTVWGSSMVAALFYSQECRRVGYPFDAGPGAMLGLWTGLINTTTSTVFGALFGLLLLGMWTVSVPFFEAFGDDVDGLSLAEWFGGTALAGLSGLVQLVFALFFSLIVGAVFGTLGGVIGGALFRVDPAPAAAPVTVQAPRREQDAPPEG